VENGINLGVLHHRQSIAISAQISSCVLPQVAETKTPQPMDVAGEFFVYD
jgi:hypothetical protein